MKAAPVGEPTSQSCDRFEARIAVRHQQAGAPENLGRPGVEDHPPGEQLPRRIDRNAAEADPGRAERRLLPEHGRRPLRRRPYENKCQCDSGNSLQDPTPTSPPSGPSRKSS